MADVYVGLEAVPALGAEAELPGAAAYNQEGPGVDIGEPLSNQQSCWDENLGKTTGRGCYFDCSLSGLVENRRWLLYAERSAQLCISPLDSHVGVSLIRRQRNGELLSFVRR